LKIGVLGSGMVAQTLGAGFLKHGHEVMLGTRDTSKLDAWASQNAKGKRGTFTEAARFGEMVVLAVKGSVALSAIKGVSGDVQGKTVIDTTNPIADAAPVNGVLPYFTTHSESLMERLQKEVPGARFVKAFNSVGAAYMVNPHFKDRPTMFICGNDETAKRSVGSLLEQLGWETADMGKVEAARAIEPLCMLWCIPGIAKNDWSPRAFKLLK
jgi:predicted dinucleotide-binding enzyme